MESAFKGGEQELMKAAGGGTAWNRTPIIYPFVGGSATTHKFNLKNPLNSDGANRLTFGSGFSHGANGVTPPGNAVAQTYLDLNLQMPQYSFSAGYYSRDNTTPGSGDTLLWGQNGMYYDIYSVNRIDVAFGQTVYSSGATTSTNLSGASSFNRLLGVTMC